MPDAPTADAPDKPPHSMKETIISLIIAFIFAFVFRGFVVEAFVIPTGSMAPTLLGQHVRFQSPESGEIWTVDPWEKNAAGAPAPIQGRNQTLTVTDPMTGAQVGRELPDSLGRNRKLMSGDRIFVLKYLYSIFDPARFDVVVFKYPGPPGRMEDVGEQENYIKRLLGLPSEEIALVDGDIFHRPSLASPGALTQSDWSDGAWEIARKSERTQRELWQPIYDSRSAPLDPERNLRRWFRDPWLGRTAAGEPDGAWQIQDRRSYVYEGSGRTVLAWDEIAWPIDDRYAYNESPGAPTRGPLGPRQARRVFPVSDIRVAAGIEPEQAGMAAAVVLEARGHEFRADIDGARIQLRMRPIGEAGSGEWRTLGETARTGAFRAGEVTNVEFWHVDQSVQVWIDGDLAAEASYAWSPALRVEHATGRSAEGLLAPPEQGNPLSNREIYRAPKVRWEFEGSPFTMHRVRLDRDLYYQPGVYNPGFTRAGEPALATHPSQPLVLGRDQFFVCGDNSPNSLDGRLWDTPDPWVYSEIDGTMGVVPRDLLIGKAFFVYFPSVHKEHRVPVPDVGRMRFIW
ncbi:MAG TPA: S26 family signal peptidase [Phycisphaerales bacterium]|nr:S26 family signal peptidase [Phycisphaerales bacterium]